MMFFPLGIDSKLGDLCCAIALVAIWRTGVDLNRLLRRLYDIPWHLRTITGLSQLFGSSCLLEMLLSALLRMRSGEGVGAIRENTKDLNRKGEDDNDGTRVGAWVCVPRPFLSCPNGVQQNGVEARLPEKERRCPGEIGEELVMERPCTQ